MFGWPSRAGDMMSGGRMYAMYALRTAGNIPMVEQPLGPKIKERYWSGTRVLAHAVLLVLTIFFVLPMVWLVLASVDSSASWQLSWPHWSLANFEKVVQPAYAGGLANSLYLSVIATIISTVTAFFAAYSFSRHHIPWKGSILLGILFLSGVPVSILMVPIYKMFSHLDWLSMLPTAVLLGVTSLPFEIYLVKNAIDAIPADLEEAASIERASTLSTLLKVIVPLAMPGVASAAIFGFVNAWGNFLLPLVLISDANQQPGPVVMYGFMNAVSVNYGAIAAFSILYSLPVVILYLCFSGSFRSGFVLGGAVK
jgi:multiple sugar transport system permease protein